jgi:hypothetical protein
MDIKLITLASYVKPQIVENKNKNWVLNGPKNSFYQYIIDRNNGSATNSSINSTYISLIYGRGLDFKDGLKGVNDWALLQKYLRPQELRKVIADFQIFNEYSVQVIRTKGGGLSSIKHLPKQLVAPSIKNEDGEIESYWYSEDWTNTNKYRPEEFSAFGTSKDAIEIYVGRPYRVGDEYISSPDYLAGLQYAEMEEEISNLNISSIRNGLSAGYIINIPDGKSWGDEEKDEFERQVKKKLTSSSNASNFIISFNGRDVEIDITPFPVNDNIHKQWDFLTKECKTQLMTAHRVISPSLVGLSSASGFSSVADEMDMSEKQTMKRVIKPKQDFIIDGITDILSQFDINLDLHFKPLTEEIEDIVEEVVEDKKETVKLAGFDPSQKRGPDGKWGSMGNRGEADSKEKINVTDKQLKDQLKSHNANDGSTFSTDGKDLFGKKGAISVSTFESLSEKIKGKDVTEQQLRNFIEKHADLLGENSEYSIGTWYDKKTGTTWLDIVTVTDMANALDLAKKHNQIAIFNLETGEEIMTGGTGVSLSFNPSQKRDKYGRWTNENNMHLIENSIKDQSFETAVIYDKEGNVLKTVDGDKLSVNVGGMPQEAHTLTHNHPNNSSFSRQDLIYLQDQKLNRMRVVTPSGVVYEVVLKDFSGNERSKFVSDYWEQATKLADKEVADYAANLYKNDENFNLYWRYKEERLAEVQKLFGRYSDRRMKYLIENTPMGSVIQYNVYE